MATRAVLLALLSRQFACQIQHISDDRYKARMLRLSIEFKGSACCKLLTSLGHQHAVMLRIASVKARARRAISGQSLAFSDAAGIIEELPTIATFGSAM